MDNIKQNTTLPLLEKSMEPINNYRPGMKIVCEQGAVWVTLTGDLKDYILTPGKQFSAPKSGKLLIEAIHDSVVRIQ
jgi:hypothetical protein